MPLPIDLDKDVAVGISLPLINGPGGYFRQTYTTLEQVTSNVLNLLLTIPGERVMQPEFGSKLHEYLFEQFDEGTEEVIENSIVEAMAKWLPYVNIENISVTDGLETPSDRFHESQYHMIVVSLTISLKVDPDTHMVIRFRGEGETGNVVVDKISQGGSSGAPGTHKSSKQTYDSIKRHTPPSL